VRSERNGAAPMPAVERLIVTLEAQKAGRFAARLESTGEIIVSDTRQPLVDGARALLAHGLDPGTPPTMRMADKSHDSFRAAPIREWAKWSYTEGEKTPLRRQRWKPREMPDAASGGTKVGCLAPGRHQGPSGARNQGVSSPARHRSRAARSIQTGTPRLPRPVIFQSKPSHPIGKLTISEKKQLNSTEAPARRGWQALAGRSSRRRARPDAGRSFRQAGERQTVTFG
jgi:hypothetical protein